MLNSGGVVTQKAGPAGSFLFFKAPGKAGRESAHALADIVLDAEEKRVLYLDLEEYRTANSVERIVGKQDALRPSRLVATIGEKLPSLIFLEEIEKGHPEVLNLFLRILEEGELTLSNGKKISFEKTVIVATSGAGHDIRKLGHASNWSSEVTHRKMIDSLIKKGTFRAEFLARFEEIRVLAGR